MSGIDEQRFKLIPIPEGRYEGVVPDYWCLRDVGDKPICWLVQRGMRTVEDGLKKDWESNFIVNRHYLGFDNTWNNSFLALTKGAESIEPYGCITDDVLFIEEIIEELLHVYNLMGYVLNEWDR